MSGYAEGIKAFSKRKILLVGDVMLDRYIYGKVERISPEAPVPVHLKERESSSLGGAGTVLRNLSDLGADTVFISVVGDDDAGHEVTKLVGKIRNTEVYLFTEMARPTTVKTRFISGHHQLARADEETCRLVTPKTIKSIYAKVLSVIKDCDAVVISDYAKGVITGKRIDKTQNEIARFIIDAAVGRGIPCIVDPKSEDFSMYAEATVITPNIPELNKAGKTDCLEEEEIILAATDLIRKYNISNMIVTRSRDGMTVVMGDGNIYNIPSAAKEVYDVTGAGDTVVAVLALGLAGGFDLPLAASIANAAAGVVVGKIGTATVSPEELIFATQQEYAPMNV